MAVGASGARFSFQVDGLPDAFRVVQIEGREQISRLFEIRLVLASEDPAIPFSGVIDRPARLTLRSDTDPRYIHGTISRFQQAEEAKQLTFYHATLVPRVFRLGLRHDSRIFQVLTVPEIIDKVLVAAGFAAGDDYRFHIYRTYWPKEYSVQYRETDWAYISRLMEEEGIFCFFEHGEDREVLVIGDAAFAHQPIQGGDTLGYHPSGGVIVQGENVTRLRYAEEVRPGKVTLRDFNFKQPGLSLEVSAEADRSRDLEVYDYPGEYDLPNDGRERAKSRLEDWRAFREHADGESNCARLSPGYTLSISDHPRESFNRGYLVTEVEHRGREAAGGETSA
ncbi:MAG: type VI secretion system tip protein VgrG, partial [Polyangiaceae bacterium]|nr:type VI secretion system tip protein VgrG [Polyangiaceae bacterium]